MSAHNMDELSSRLIKLRSQNKPLINVCLSVCTYLSVVLADVFQFAFTGKLMDRIK